MAVAAAPCEEQDGLWEDWEVVPFGEHGRRRGGRLRWCFLYYSRAGGSDLRLRDFVKGLPIRGTIYRTTGRSGV
jgi:hypothetical protein